MYSLRDFVRISVQGNETSHSHGGITPSGVDAIRAAPVKSASFDECEAEMPRRVRLEFQGATHWVRLIAEKRHARSSGWIAAAEGKSIEQALSQACMECGANLHAYYIGEGRMAFLAHTRGSSMSSLMQRLSSRYYHLLRASAHPTDEKLANRRYDSKVVAPDYAPYVVRRIHNIPVISGLCAQRIDYPFSSERAYLGEASRVTLDMAPLMNALEQRGYFGLRGYRQFMAKNDTPRVAELLTRGAAADPRIIGDPEFVQLALRAAATRTNSSSSLDGLVLTVSELMGQPPSIVRSRTRLGTLARALVAWYGVRQGVSSLAATARAFGVTTAALGQAMRRHRAASARLFAAIPHRARDD